MQKANWLGDHPATHVVVSTHLDFELGQGVQELSAQTENKESRKSRTFPGEVESYLGFEEASPATKSSFAHGTQQGFP